MSNGNGLKEKRVIGRGKAIYVVHDGKFRIVRGKTLEEYKAIYPKDNVIEVGEPPSTMDLEEMLSDGVAEAVDGCGGIEPDGHCKHGHPSWLLALGLI